MRDARRDADRARRRGAAIAAGRQRGRVARAGPRRQGARAPRCDERRGPPHALRVDEGGAATLLSRVRHRGGKRLPPLDAPGDGIAATHRGEGAPCGAGRSRDALAAGARGEGHRARRRRSREPRDARRGAPSGDACAGDERSQPRGSLGGAARALRGSHSALADLESLSRGVVEAQADAAGRSGGASKPDSGGSGSTSTS